MSGVTVPARLLVAALLPPLLLLSNILFFTFYEGHYLRLWDKYDVAEAAELTPAELEEALNLTLAYLRDEVRLADLTLERGGSQEPLYGARATAHLVDVRDLVRDAFRWRLVLAAGTGAALIGGLLAAGRWRSWLGETLRLAAWISFVGTFVLVLPFLLDFHRFWDIFHEIFFANQLWRLSYSERMLRMFPAPFFLETILWIGAVWALQVGLMLGIGRALKRAPGYPGWKNES